MTEYKQHQPGPEIVRLRRISETAPRVRKLILDSIHGSGASHIGTAYSIVEILLVLYGEILKTDPKDPWKLDRDRFILSKGHGCIALYAVLAEYGFFPKKWLDTFYRNGSMLLGHATHKNTPGVEVSTGSLGHGLPIATGMALAARRERAPYRVFTLMSDGECDEGSVWEAAMFAGHHKLENLTVIIDYNKIQSLGRTSEILDLEPLGDKWRSFRWSVREVDGHDVTQLRDALSAVPWEPGKPSCIIAHTIKGKGVTFMEDRLLWHYRCPDPEEYSAASRELGVSAH